MGRFRQGQVLAGRYRLEERLGAGAIGVVWRAQHELMRRPVAVKLLHAEAQLSEEIVARFRREAEAAARIEHVNVCAALDFGALDDGGCYLVMEYLDGVTLEQVLHQHGRLPPDRAVHLALQIADALGAAHDAGVVHRDLKPENIMLVTRDDLSDVVKVLDFGVAKFTGPEAGPELTQAGFLYGTPHYMSPEQTVAGHVDGRADLYSLGVMLFEMLTGKLPFDDADIMRVVRMHLQSPPPAMAAVAPGVDIPRALQQVVSRLLAKERDARYQSAAEVREALQSVWAPAKLSTGVATLRALRGAVGQARAVAARASRSRSRHAAVALAAIGALAGATGVWVAGAGSDASPRPGATAGAPETAAVDAVPALLGTGRAPAPATAARERRRRLPGAAPPAPVASAALLDARARFAVRDDIQMALRSLAAGDVEVAVAGLRSAADAPELAPHAHYFLGKAYAEAARWGESMGHFGQAVALDPRYGSDPELQDHVFGLFEMASTATAQPAIDLVTQRLAGPARERLAHLTRESPHPFVRERAWRLLVDSGELARLEPWSRAAAGLRMGGDCAARAEHLAALERLADPRSVAVVRALAQSRRGCGVSGDEDCHGCMRERLDALLVRLEAAP